MFITVELPDAQNVKLKLEPEGKFYFSATAGVEKIPYEVDIDLFDKIDVDVRATSLWFFFICKCQYITLYVFLKKKTP